MREDHRKHGQWRQGATPRPGARAQCAPIWRRAGGVAARPGGAVAQQPIELMAELEAERIRFQSVTESIDSTSPGGKLVFHILGALAEFERNLIRERTYAGLAAARARGRKGVSPKKLGDEQRAVAVDLYRQKRHTHTIDEICKAVGISSTTLCKYAAAAGDS